MHLLTEPYCDQVARWPSGGRQVLAQFTADAVVVYQAYRPAIADYAVAHQRFGGPFGFGRMSWIKPNFLWMMYRSGWGTKEDQECILALHLQRVAFATILLQAVHSTFLPELYASRESWSQAKARSAVRLQWDPDHNPYGAPVSRRAIQLGLRGTVLRAFATEWLLRIEDISDFVAQQRQVLATSPGQLLTPIEHVLPLAPDIVARLGADLQSQGHA